MAETYYPENLQYPTNELTLTHKLLKTALLIVK